MEISVPEISHDPADADPIGIEPTISTLPVEQRAIVPPGQTRGEQVAGVLVPTIVPQANTVWTLKPKNWRLSGSV